MTTDKKQISTGTAAGRSGASYAPLYYRVYHLLLLYMRNRDHGPDMPLPPESELCKQFQVSRVTLRRALDILEADGLITRRRGRGTFARRPAPENVPTFRGVIDDLGNFERSTQARLLGFERLGMPQHIVALLDREAGEPCLRIERVRSDAISPVSYLVSYVPYPEAGLLEAAREQLGSTPVAKMLYVLGTPITQGEQWLSATLADATTARELDVEMGSALISLTRVTRLADGRPIEALRALYRPDRYEYRVGLVKADAGKGPYLAEVVDTAMAAPLAEGSPLSIKTVQTAQ